MDDLPHQILRGPVRAVVRARGPVGHLGFAHRLVSIGSPFRRRPGHVELVGGEDYRPPIVDDQTRDAQTVTGRQSSISVDEDLQVRDVVCL